MTAPGNSSRPASRGRLLWEAVRHTAPRQLAHRLRLLIKRKLMTRGALPGKFAAKFVATEIPALAPDPLPPLFAPRAELVEREGTNCWLRYLNRRDPLRVPNEWHPRELEHGTRLEKLNLHYMEYLEALDDSWFKAVIADWIDQNPPYRPGYWLDNWNSYSLSIRCVVWMQQLARRRERIEDRTLERIHGSLARQLRFLCRNLELDICGNHIVKNLKALFWGARYFSGTEAARWAALAQGLLERELAEQLLPDGMHFELSPAYHAQVFADLLECYAAMPAGAGREFLGQRLGAMAQVLADLTHPDGCVSLFNDGGLHMAYSPAECLAVYRQLCGGSVTARPQVALPDAGYWGLRAADSYFVFDAGRVGPDSLPAHAHGDIFAFEWDVRGQRIIVDTGVFEYHPGQWRAYSRSTRAHNTVTLAQEDQCEFWKAFRVGRRANVQVRQVEQTGQSLVIEGSHDGYHRLPGSPTHIRKVSAQPGQVRVEDRLEGAGGYPATARLLLHPECQVDGRGTAWTIRRGEVRVTLESSHPCVIEEAWWMPDFGHRLAAKQIVIAYGPLPCRGGFTLQDRTASQ